MINKLKKWDISNDFDIKKYPFTKRVKNVKYYQEKNGWCSISIYDDNNNCILYQNSDGVFIAREFDLNNNIISIMNFDTWKRNEFLKILLND